MQVDGHRHDLHQRIRPPRPEALPPEQNLPRRGVLFVGDRGLMLCGGAGGAVQLLPESRTTEFRQPNPSITRSNGHHRDWIDAIKGGPRPSSHFEYAAILTEITLLGVAALRLQKRIEWDSPSMTVTNFEGWEPVIRGQYRKGWEIV